jgi:hypothetical protein
LEKSDKHDFVGNMGKAEKCSLQRHRENLSHKNGDK